MSYSRHLRVLIVEDEQKAHDEYEELFEKLRTSNELGVRFDMAPPVFARFFEDAKRHLEEQEIYHLVIVDLGLPHGRDGEAEAGVEPGRNLVLQASRREDYPIPVLLVISGRLNYKLGELREILAQEFWHGEFVTKGFEQSDRIIVGLHKAQEYVDVGIHFRNAPGRLSPTLSPREEDLLRRCVLGRPECCGVDVEWWGSYHGSSARALPAAEAEPTKVLMGRFLLRDGFGHSRPAFFKLEPRESAKYSHHFTEVLANKLGHMKVLRALDAGGRSLLVTEKAGDSETNPISFETVLSSPECDEAGVVASIAEQLAGQLRSLATEENDRWPLSRLFWRYFDRAKLGTAWERHGGDTAASALELLETLRTSLRVVSVTLRSCTHGDLNVTNIAFDRTPGDGFHACIIDPGCTKRDLAIRDLANLEVSLLLHHSISGGVSLVEECRALYEAGAEAVTFKAENHSLLAARTLCLIRELRSSAFQLDELPIYAVAVFNCAMLQLEGLAIQPRGNRIAHPPDAVLLAHFSAEWLRSVAGDLLSPGPSILAEKVTAPLQV